MIRSLALLISAALLAAVVGWSVFVTALDRLNEQGEADLTLAADRVTGQLLRYREVAVFLARHPELKAALTDPEAIPQAETVVQSMSDMTGAADVSVIGVDGRIIVGSADSEAERQPNLPPLDRALTGALGTTNEIIVTNGAAHRAFAFAAPVFGDDGAVIGAVMTRMGVSQIEDNWPGDAPPVIFVDRRGLIFITNRLDLILNPRTTGMPTTRSRIVSGHELFWITGNPYLPNRALHLERTLPSVGLEAEILIDARSAFYGAVLWGLIAGGGLIIFAGVLYVVQQKRRTLAALLAAEEAANAQLEARVSERTQELTTLNANLRREVTERKEAEAALKRAQDDLVQAGKLSALGQMSAGISHELNQPLMAIRSFAENGEAFFERGKPEIARENLGRIAELARRMGRIIGNLRAFARQESGPVTNVNLNDVVAAALEVTDDKIARHGVTVLWDAPAPPVIVRGGEVRLQQVLVNLISNAVDAMPEGGEVHVTLGAGDVVRLTVRDTGPGIADPDRVFDPFYTTKAVGAAEGMGLGLSISYGLVQSFGGTIRGANHPEGGAVFTVELVPANLEDAA